MKILLITLLIVLAGCTVDADNGADHALTWTQSANANGYTLHCGPVTGGYVSEYMIGNVSRQLLKPLAMADGVHFCAMSAFNFAGNSGFSNEITFATIGGELITQPPVSPTDLSAD